MKVSILVPIYGVEHYIEQCARSLFEQSYSDIEYIFVNDCTPDSSMDILKQVLSIYPNRKSQVRIIEHEHNQGLGAARLTATKAATGEAVMHVDSDDYITPMAVELLVATMERTGASLVDGAFQEESGGRISPPITPFAGNTEVYLKLILCQNILPHHIWARLIKKDLYTTHNIFSISQIDYAEDYAIVPRLLLHAKRATIQESVYIYRTDNMESYTHNIKEKHNISFFKSNRLVLDFIEREDKNKRYTHARYFAQLAVLRHARRFGATMQQVNQYCPMHFDCSPWYIKLCALMFTNQHISYRLAVTLYRLTRRLYKEFITRF